MDLPVLQNHQEGHLECLVTWDSFIGCEADRHSFYILARPERSHNVSSRNWFPKSNEARISAKAKALKGAKEWGTEFKSRDDGHG